LNLQIKFTVAVGAHGDAPRACVVVRCRCTFVLWDKRHAHSSALSMHVPTDRELQPARFCEEGLYASHFLHSPVPRGVAFAHPGKSYTPRCPLQLYTCHTHGTGSVRVRVKGRQAIPRFAPEPC